MGIVVQPSKTSRVRALAERRPDLLPSELARHLGLRLSEVKEALRRDRRARRKSVAP